MKKNKPQEQQEKEPAVVNVDAKHRVLFIDDDAAIRDVLSIVFERAGFELDLMASATDILRNKFTVPDLFLIDKQLSGYSGVDLCQYLKDQKTTWHIPIIMISASPDIHQVFQKAGADDYIKKPFNTKFLVEMVRYYIQNNPGNGSHPKKFRDIDQG